MVVILYDTGLQIAFYIQFRAPAKSTHYLLQKKLQLKVVQNWISYRKVCERICLSPQGAELSPSKDWCGCYIKAHPHLYANGNKANANGLLVQHSPHKRMSKRSAGHSLAARMNVHQHQYDCKRIFLWSTDSRWIAFVYLPNIRHISEWRWMLFAYTSVYIMHFACVFAFVSHLSTDVDVVLHSTETTNYI